MDREIILEVLVVLELSEIGENGFDSLCARYRAGKLSGNVGVARICQ